MAEQKISSPLSSIKVAPLAAESFGARSMCTLVETPDATFLLDAGVSLCPWRFGLPPHPVEFQTIARLRRKIAEAADEADVVTVSHYHFDHHTPLFEDWVVNWTEANATAQQIYRGKTVLVRIRGSKSTRANGSGRGFSRRQAANTRGRWCRLTAKPSPSGRRSCVSPNPCARLGWVGVGLGHHGDCRVRG